MKLFPIAPLPTSDYPDYRVVSFDVDARGTVYALLYTYRDGAGATETPAPQYFIIRFKDDGSVDSAVHVSPPPDTEASFFTLVSFAKGNFFVTGTSRHGGHEGPFSAIYDSSGRLVRTVVLPNDVSYEEQPTGAGPAPLEGEAGNPQVEETPADAAAFALMTGRAITSPEGYFYLLRNSTPLRIYAVDSGGSVVRSFSLASPLTGATALDMGLAGPASLFFDFGYLPTGSSAEPPKTQRLLAIFNTLSGRFETLYALLSGDKGLHLPACTDRHGGFLYLGSTTDNHLTIFDYGP